MNEVDNDSRRMSFNSASQNNQTSLSLSNPAPNPTPLDLGDDIDSQNYRYTGNINFERDFHFLLVHLPET